MSSYGMPTTPGGTGGATGGGNPGASVTSPLSADGSALGLSGMASSSSSASSAPVDPATQMRSFTAHLSVLADPGQKDEAKLKSAQELSDNLDLILASPLYQQFLSNAMTVFIKLLQEGRPHFIAEYNVQQVRPFRRSR